MSLAQMSVSGTVMILAAVVIRALLLHRLPKRTFTVLWWIILVRLLMPFSLPCSFSAYSLLTNDAAESTAGNAAALPVIDLSVRSAPFAPDLLTGSTAKAVSYGVWTAVWLTGMLMCAVFFTVSYIKCRILFDESLPVDNEYIGQWLAEHRLRRRVSVRCSDRISAPLTYGVFRPVILLPKSFEQIDKDDLKFVLAHEHVHIRRCDVVFKLALTAALCVHWFNPLVWVMYIIANRDIEMSCDEAVIRMLGEREKSAYALTLIRMAEEKCCFAPLSSSFGKKPIKERVIGIMKFKKATVLTVLASACLVIGTTTAFATSARHSDTETLSDSAETSISESIPDEKPHIPERPADSTDNAEPIIPEMPADSTDVASLSDQLPPAESPEDPVDKNEFPEVCSTIVKPGEDVPMLKDILGGEIPPEIDGCFIDDFVCENGDTIVYYTLHYYTGTYEDSVQNFDDYTHELVFEGGVLYW